MSYGYGSPSMANINMPANQSGYFPDQPAPAYQPGPQPLNGPFMNGYPPPNGYGYPGYSGYPGYPPPGPQYYPQPQPVVQNVVVQQTSQNNNDTGLGAGGCLACLAG
ncbi:hypothetical protein FRC03_007662, partial [Tulasnella sp. 419]